MRARDSNRHLISGLLHVLLERQGLAFNLLFGALIVPQLWVGKIPYPDLVLDWLVIQATLNDGLPYRREQFSSREKNDAVWTLMELCWERIPENRPQVDRVQKEVVRICSTL